MYHAEYHLIIYKQCSSFMALTKWNDYTCFLFYSPNKMETLNQKNKMETLLLWTKFDNKFDCCLWLQLLLISFYKM